MSIPQPPIRVSLLLATVCLAGCVTTPEQSEIRTADTSRPQATIIETAPERLIPVVGQTEETGFRLSCRIAADDALFDLIGYRIPGVEFEQSSDGQGLLTVKRRPLDTALKMSLDTNTYKGKILRMEGEQFVASFEDREHWLDISGHSARYSGTFVYAYEFSFAADCTL